MRRGAGELLECRIREGYRVTLVGSRSIAFQALLESTRMAW